MKDDKNELTVLAEANVLYQRLKLLSTYLGCKTDSEKGDESTPIKEILAKLSYANDEIDYCWREVKKLK